MHTVSLYHVSLLQILYAFYQDTHKLSGAFSNKQTAKSVQVKIQNFLFT